MQVILLENIRNLGKFGSKVTVANGYGRNFLIPNGKAVPATKENLASFESKRADLEKAARDRLSNAQERAAEISNIQLKISMLAGDEGKLYGSIGTIELVKAFKEKGIDVTRQEIRLPNGSIRELGEYEVELQLHAEVVARVKLNVLPEMG
ncbi:50S ribosomal protein L9 [Candidatus Berkiella cookevillensis]|uniref:Large ribosomal subunit protein bL9 n=1 Tax=Candidatus Berkiella cookevillensis TaxID=437022 RepID=A0A0Q9YRW9_9GAMM|nr:50S ribosomal protein L9 [Candidatus Berkiella cookevillensis]MCS5707563.1 50S ribosomal protein L9 [Candidatus Berkiella cookevillensis]